MIKKLKKTNVFVLTIMSLVAIIAICLFAVGIATALEGEAAGLNNTASEEAIDATLNTEEESNPASDSASPLKENPSNDASVTVSPATFYTLGEHTLTLTIKDYAEYNYFYAIWVSGPGYFNTIDVGRYMEANPFIYYTTPEIPFTEYGRYTITVVLRDNVQPKNLATNFEITSIPPAEINLKINESDVGQAVIGQNSNFTVELSKFPPSIMCKAYIKARDPENNIRFFDDTRPILITSSTLSYDFVLMPNSAGNWNVEVTIVDVSGATETVVQRGTKTFVPVEDPSPDPPGPGPEPVPTPDPGGGGTVTPASETINVAQTGDTSLFSILTFGVLFIAGAATFVCVSRKIKKGN